MHLSPGVVVVVFPPIQQHISGYLGVTDELLWSQGKALGAVLTPSGVQGVMAEPILCKNKAHPMLCGTLKTHFIYSLPTEGFLPVHNPWPQHKAGTIPWVLQEPNSALHNPSDSPGTHSEPKLFVFIYSLNSRIQSKLLQ